MDEDDDEHADRPGHRDRLGEVVLELGVGVELLEVGSQAEVGPEGLFSRICRLYFLGPQIRVQSAPLLCPPPRTSLLGF